MASERGHPVSIPDLTGFATAGPPRWEAFVRIALDAGSSLGPGTAVIGHSGAGACLPQIRHGLEGAAKTIFIDAIVPPERGEHRTSSEVARRLDEQTVAGMLRPWLEWWPAGVIDELLPRPEDRARLAADLPVLPRSLYDEPIPVPEGWSDRDCGFIQLSHAYDREYEEAGRRGWARRSLEADHLSIFTRAEVVMDELEMVLEAA